jgi:hypothetical protein
MTDLGLIRQALLNLLNELVDGSAAEAAWALNPEDPGLLKSLDKLSAEEASAVPLGGGGSVAAHVDHLRYGLELLNRWSGGEEDPFADADYSASWQRITVSETEWAGRRDALRREVYAWREAIQRPRIRATATEGEPEGKRSDSDERGPERELSDVELTGIVASVTHLAYHLGAIRQIHRSTRGPTARD